MKQNSNVRRMTALALLIAIVVVMSLTPLGYLQVGPLSMSLLTIPVAVAAMVLGPTDGAIIGLAFGLTSFYSAAVGRSAMGTALFAVSPGGMFVVTVVARVLEGWLAGLIFQAMTKKGTKDSKPAYFVTGLMTAVLNTVFFMGFLVLFFYNCDYVQSLAATLNVDNALMFIITLVGVQGLIEAVVCCLVSSAVSIPLRKIWVK
ncbi:ECF transporter S component [Catenisphaera adipataccumulans]|jgi:uncharacterized membrane protein|uniref:Putative membrane protein n=1 Tax=Catenisphaera adipataccumulans TaxID=700500 RepID=A0A7W8FY51_9FIRM|nr:ECF transporter S component [Catenisphaera adipataccumulans]MBB5183652.1 putative membrane protein [Catenisphaera adipataccumulans]